MRFSGVAKIWKYPVLQWPVPGNFHTISSSLPCYFQVISDFHENSIEFPYYFHKTSALFPTSTIFPYNFLVPHCTSLLFPCSILHFHTISPYFHTISPCFHPITKFHTIISCHKTKSHHFQVMRKRLVLSDQAISLKHQM